ncbi:MAG: hypothetical protein ACTSSN_02665 [Candidatus Heimdallarchaeaceae archaeon]
MDSIEFLLAIHPSVSIEEVRKIELNGIEHILPVDKIIDNVNVFKAMHLQIYEDSLNISCDLLKKGYRFLYIRVHKDECYGAGPEYEIRMELFENGFTNIKSKCENYVKLLEVEE